MKPLPMLAALVIAGLPPALGQEAAGGGDPERDLKGIERAWSLTIVKRDAKALEQLLPDDYVLTTPEGRLVSKAQLVQSFRSPGDPSFAIKNIDLDEMKVRVFGETAVVSSRFTLKAESEGRIVETPFRHTDVFVRREGAWRCVSRQATRIRQSYGHDPATDD